MRLIVVTFFILGYGFYQLSGGADFEPEKWRSVQLPDTTAHLAASAPDAQADTRAAQETLGTAQQPAPALVNTTASLAIFANIPTRRSLVGEATPTPINARTALGPNPLQQATANGNVALPVVPAALPQREMDVRIGGGNDVRIVRGNRVNMRNGPGTQYSVVARLGRDSAVEVLQDPGQGWVKLQTLDTGRIGWMSASLLRKQNF